MLVTDKCCPLFQNYVATLSRPFYALGCELWMRIESSVVVVRAFRSPRFSFQNRRAPARAAKLFAI